MHGPVRIPQHFACQRHQVATAIGEIGFRLRRFGDQADSHCRDLGFAPDALGKWYVIAGDARYDGERQRTFDAARGAVHHIDPAQFQLARERNGILDLPSTALAVDTRGAKEQRAVLRPRVAGSFDHLEAEPHAAGEIAAVAIVAAIGDGREELLDDVAVGAVDFADVETGIERASARFRVTLNNAPDVVAIHLDRNGRAGLEGDRTWSVAPPWRPAALRVILRERLEAFPWSLGRDLPAGVPKLDRAERTLPAQEIGDPAPCPRLSIGVDPGATVGLASARFDRSLLDKDNSGTPHGELAEMDQVPVAGLAVDRQILRHRRHHDAIARRHPAHGERGEQQRRWRHWCRLVGFPHTAIPEMATPPMMRLDRR